MIRASLDGVVQDPDGEEGFRLGGWFGQFGGKDGTITVRITQFASDGAGLQQALEADGGTFSPSGRLWGGCRLSA